MKRMLTIAWVVWLSVLRRKDVYVVFALMLAALITLMSFNIFGMGALTGYVKEAGLLFVWIFALVLAVSVSSRVIPEEEARGTVYSLLARPVSRGGVVVGKWLGSWTVVSAAAACFYAVIVLIVLSRGGGFCWITLAQAVILHFCLLAMICSLGIAFSTRLHHDAAATLTYSVTIAAMLFLPRAPYLAAEAGRVNGAGLLVLYYALPHFELFDIRMRLVHDWDPVAMSVFAELVVYAVVTTAIFLLLGWFGYRNRRFERGVIQ